MLNVVYEGVSGRVHAMEPGWAVFISIVIGALIGGLTNLLAIVMLFRPHKAWKIGKWSFPFTPGLIPKRHVELARQLGAVVEQHLLSPDSVTRFILETLEPGWIRRTVFGWLDRWSESEKTVAEGLAAVGWPARNNLALSGGGESINWVERLLSLLRQRMLTPPARTLAEWLGEDGTAQVRVCIPALAHWVWGLGNEMLNREQGRRQFFQLVRDFLHNSLRGGRMWQTVAAFFVDEEKVAAWLYRRLSDWLARPATKERLAQWLTQQWDVFAHKPLAELVGQEGVNRLGNGEEDGKSLLEGLAGVAGLVAERGVRELSHAPIKDLLAAFNDETVRRTLAAVLEAAEGELVRRLPSFFKRLPVGRVVERQVLRYPLPELEKLILQIASRELKMITLLGALIGGFVGLVQGMWMVVFLR
mgnify:CR=1 FL=1